MTNLLKYKNYNGKLVHGDVLEVLRALPKNHKFDLVIADPPYNIGKDFGNGSDSRTLEDYVDWTLDWLTLCLERLKPDGLIYMYGFAEILAHVAVHFPLKRQRWLVWHYTNKTTPSARFWQRSHESILCLWPSERARPPLEIDQIREPYTDHYHRCIGKARKATPSRFGAGRTTTYNGHKQGALPRDVIKVPALAGGAGRSERWFLCYDCGEKIFPPEDLRMHDRHKILKHPTQKPMQLTNRLIKSRINGQSGNLLIPFAGSGAECVAAHALAVSYLGIELNPHYVKFAQDWLGTLERAATDAPTNAL